MSKLGGITREECLERAAYAERLAKLVAFASDKENLLREAEAWRRRAASLPRPPHEADEPD